MNCLEAFDQVCRKIVIPTRHQIDDQNMIDRKFRGNTPHYHLTKIKNNRHQYLSTIIFFKQSSYPTIIYMHGNGGNKLEVLHLVKLAENQPFNFVSFDFSGCGKSEGQFITYGEQQVDDIHSITSFMKNNYGSKIFFLWGRSMGASLSLLYGSKYINEIKGMVLDSPFRSLQKVVFNVATSSQPIVPNFLINIGIYFMKNKVQKIVHQDIFDIDYARSYETLTPQQIPLLFAFSTRDSVVKQEDVIEMYNLYSGPKKLSQFSCLHPENRPKNFVEKALEYLSSIIGIHIEPIKQKIESPKNIKSKTKIRMNQALFNSNNRIN